jgi:hypothetical protein
MQTSVFILVAELGLEASLLSCLGDAVVRGFGQVDLGVD